MTLNDAKKILKDMGEVEGIIKSFGKIKNCTCVGENECCFCACDVYKYAIIEINPKMNININDLRLIVYGYKDCEFEFEQNLCCGHGCKLQIINNKAIWKKCKISPIKIASSTIY